ncbi:MAG TPA: hypothetical protein EYP78_04575, partial [Candidatus Omnitrophica bacterium]|nr:hypothetical protein [Candidatus Omnitrophota bacterium]
LGELVSFSNKRFNATATRKDIHDWSFFPPELHYEFRHSGGYRRSRLLPGAKDFLSWLRSIVQVSIVTIRAEEYKPDTFEWLEENIPGLYEPENVHFTGGSKLDTYRRLGVALLIDDSVRHTKEVAENFGIYAILYNNGTPMFKNAENHPRIYKAENLDEVRRYVVEIKSLLYR